MREVYDNTPPAGATWRPVHLPRRREGKAAERLDARERQRLVLEGLARYFGPQALDAIEVIERDWSQEEWTRGAYAATFGIGGLSRHGPDLTRPVGPIHWACTDLAGVGHMHMEGADPLGPGRRTLHPCVRLTRASLIAWVHCSRARTCGGPGRSSRS